MPTTNNKYYATISIMAAATATAILLQLIQNHIPPSEVPFITSTSLFCLLFIFITADPITFYTIVGPYLPFASWRVHGRKSIQFLQRGETLVAKDAASSTVTATAASGGGDLKDTCKEQSSSNNNAISLQLLIHEIRKRIQKNMSSHP